MKGVLPMKKLFTIIAILGFLIFGFGNSYALKTYYNNKTGYNNKIPYKAFFNGHSPKPEKINIQKGKVQAVVPLHEKEENVEQKGLKK